MAGQWRLFVAIDLGDEARRALGEAQAVCRRANLPARWVDPAGAHLTLKFLGERDRAQVEPIGAALRAVAARHRPVMLRTGAPGAFPNPRRARVLWLGLEGALEPLDALQREIDGALAGFGFPREGKPFRPHLTLGRVREGASLAADALAAAFAGVRRAAAPLPVEEIRLMRSELGPGGARYTTLLVAPLGGGMARGAGNVPG